jgi:general secretion pathway protein J
MRRSAPPGFTLLELLVALVVLGFVLAGIAQGVQFGLRAWTMQSQDVGAHADVDAADRVLRHLIAQMDPGTSGAPPNLVGSAGSLAFTTDLGQAAAALGVHDANVALLVQDHNLVLRWTPVVHGVRLDPAPPPATTVLLPGVDRVEFAYWAHGEGGAGSWQTTWVEKDLPPIVKIRLIFPAAAHRRWPDIVAPTMRLRPSD